MLVRFLVLLLIAAFPALANQRGFYGPVSNRPAAGDLAPDISFTEEVSAPSGASWRPSNLFGQMTVLGFFPDTSHNLQTVTDWNALIDQFAGKPVQFVWITGEKESSLVPWLAEHPLKGFVLLDPDGATGRSYGMEIPTVTVIVGADGKIIGFDNEFVPSATHLDAALEGRITTTRLKPGAAEFQAFIESHEVLLEAQAPQMPAPPERPNFPPSYTLHVVPSSQIEGTSWYSGDASEMDFRSFKGFDLKTVISWLYHINPIRIELPASLDNSKRYDFSMLLPEQESGEQMNERFQQGIQDYFHLTAVSEDRLMDVYVVTADGQKLSAVKLQSRYDLGGEVTSGNVGFEFSETADDQKNDATVPKVPKVYNLSAVDMISIDGTTDDFCHELESKLDRPVVNETNIGGHFGFHVDRSQGERTIFSIASVTGWGSSSHLISETSRYWCSILAHLM